MPNALKGEVAFEAGGETYVLLLDFNALCELEGALTPGDDRNGPRATRATLWAALRRNRPDITLDEAGDVITAATLPEVRKWVQAAYEAAGLDEVLGGNTAHPRKAPAKTGALKGRSASGSN